MNRFDFFIPLKKGADGLIGIASTLSVDRDGERMSTDALNEMKEEIVKKGVNLFGNHEHQWENTLGVVNNAKVENNSLIIQTRLDNPDTNPKVKMLLEKMKRGIKLGLSVGGTVTRESYEFDKALNRKVKVIDGVRLFEISVVGIPSNADSFLSLPDAIHKSAEHKIFCPICYSKIVKGICLGCLYNRADELRKQIKFANAPEEIERLDQLNEISLAKFGRLFNDLNENEKDEILTQSMSENINKSFSREARYNKQKAENVIEPNQEYMSAENMDSDPMAQVPKEEIKKGGWGPFSGDFADIVEGAYTSGKSKSATIQMMMNDKRFQEEEGYTAQDVADCWEDAKRIYENVESHKVKKEYRVGTESNRDDLAEKYNDMIDQANGTIVKNEIHAKYMDGDLEKPDIFLNSCKEVK